jgi:hypothetical protein
MKSVLESFSRRRVLKGVLGATAVTVGLPFLDCFLDTKGQALAATGQQLPVRFGTWFWGLGMNSKVFVPKKYGADYDLPEEIASWKSIREHVNLFTNYRVLLDGRPNICHYSGWVAIRCGQAPVERGKLPGQSLDVTVSDAIGGGTRFRSIQMTAEALPRDSYSFRDANTINPPEVSAHEMYTHIFGPDFTDPNAADFKPDTRTMVRASALSGVSDDITRLKKVVSQNDLARLDQYFTSLRELEQRLALELEKPAPAEACTKPGALATEEPPLDMSYVNIGARHKLMTDVLVMAVACNQTKVFNMMWSESSSNIIKPGLSQGHHGLTHEELIDEKLGYQPNCHFLTMRAMEAYAYFIEAFTKVKEGDGTLLDRMLIMSHSDHEFAKVHSVIGIPMMTAGKAGGRIKTGLHINGNGGPNTLLSLTVLQAMGLSVDGFGGGAMRVDKTVSEIMV